MTNLFENDLCDTLQNESDLPDYLLFHFNNLCTENSTNKDNYSAQRLILSKGVSGMYMFME